MTNKLTPSKIKAFNAAIGRFVLEWASVEVGIDLLVMILARESEPKELDHEIGRKLKFIERRIQNVTWTATAINETKELIQELRKLVPTRHDYVHGAIIGYALTRSKLTVTLGRLLQPPKGERRKPAKVTETILDATSDRLRKIGDRLLDLAEPANHLAL